MRHRRLALLLTLCTAILLVAACGKHRASDVAGLRGLVGGAGDALKKPTAVQVCHVGEDGKKSVLVIPEKALASHLAHGDVQLVDADGDGYVAAANDCVPGGDCDDNDPNVHPGATELCNGRDDDCDGLGEELPVVMGTQSCDIVRDPARLRESAMGNLVADALRAKYPGVEAALINSGSLRQDLRFNQISQGEAPGEITCGELFAVLPFGNVNVILTLTGDQLRQALESGLSPACNPSVGTGRFPQVAGLKITYLCNGTSVMVTGMWKTPQGIGGPQIPIGPTDTIRLVTNDFMYGGGDGYTILQQGTNVVQPGDLLLTALVEYVQAHSPICHATEGRITQPQ